MRSNHREMNAQIDRVVPEQRGTTMPTATYRCPLPDRHGKARALLTTVSAEVEASPMDGKPHASHDPIIFNQALVRFLHEVAQSASSAGDAPDGVEHLMLLAQLLREANAKRSPQRATIASHAEQQAAH